MSETSEILPEILLAMSRHGATGFRNNTGTGWVGSGQPTRLGNGNLVLQSPVRPLKAGLITGSSDVIGWVPVLITEEMVGKKIAVFTAIEAKKPKKNPTREQQTFIDNVLESGGLAGVAGSSADAVKIITNLDFINDRT